MGFWSVLFIVMIFVPIFGLMAATPYLTRKTISFGVSVSEENYHHPAVKKMRKSYAQIIGLLGIVVVTGSLILTGLLTDEQFAWIINGLLIILLAVSGISYLYFYQKMKNLKQELGWKDPQSQIIAVDTRFRSQKLGYSNLWFLIHAAFMLLSAAFVWMQYDRIPDMIVMKYDFQGVPTNIVEKSYQSVFFPNVMQLCMIVTFIFVNMITMKSKQQINASNPESSMQQNVAFRRLWSLYAIILGFLLIALFSFIQLGMIYSFSYSVNASVSMITVAIILIGTIVLGVRTGQGGSRIRTSETTVKQVQINDDKFWKLGAFYYNPQDPSLFVEKRMGIGWTINMGRPLGWVIMIGLPLVLILAPLLLTR
ncbi:DUF1648 domain-containing protein [Paenibacillus eucommiae]|uniref:Membrane protein n=1 Tax=Paenibacillus eucommiae TaxID=1355755 RepID=A0ABS4ISQ4_9BACL|nr:DUF5808 domain-containing protein [Paenibacillus eucommiae]MBP1990046.1 putative membrane protein [Paenibacillus eucommiae]